MEYFVLLLALWVVDEDNNKEQYMWAVDTGMTYADCHSLMWDMEPLVKMIDGEMACVVDDNGKGE